MKCQFVSVAFDVIIIWRRRVRNGLAGWWTDAGRGDADRADRPLHCDNAPAQRGRRRPAQNHVQPARYLAHQSHKSDAAKIN